MYADREEALRSTPGAPTHRGTGAPRPDLEERERELQEQLRRRAAESRRRDGPDESHAYRARSPDAHRRYDSRAMRRRGDEEYENGRPRSYDDRRDAPPPPRRRSRSPIADRAPRRNDDYEVRSVFCSQLPSQVGERDLGEFFEETLGKDSVLFVQLVYDYHNAQFTNTAFVELADPQLVLLAIAMHGRSMFGKPISVQSAEGAKLNAAADCLLMPRADVHPPPPMRSHSPAPRGGGGGGSGGGAHGAPGPSARLYVGNLHYDIGSDQVRAVFAPFGELDEAEVYYDNATGKSKGFAFVQFKHADDAQRATDQLNGFELAGRQMRVGTSKARPPSGSRNAHAAPLTTRFDEGGGGGVNSTEKRFALMEKLARTDSQSQEPYVVLLTQYASCLDSPCVQHVAPPQVHV